ncbi:SsrA-binding protein SmpB [Planctomicrobium piriforme]|uniref:SsrA-binding protein n=1 Tax=Planctomicrobium piriforme TaxID=1576369 RepID=A0A1I3BAR3_9PLAN|nr:SsrA-binding protein SmpB [Planctomicrobium piriforme]SFH59378.1 SsrA-binding protein [Planctomicrobium piriforme]
MAPRNKTSAKDDPNTRVVCRNRRARHDYDILDEIECGMVLMGSEVKSIRDNKISIDEAFARMENGEVWLHNCDIAEYPQATYLNHQRRRSRKLLLNRREIRKFVEAAEQSGMTMIPLDVHFTNGRVKVQLAIGKGRKVHDKRDRLKETEAKKNIRAALRRERD